MIIPVDRLEAATLSQVIREWLMRQGEDWGLADTPLDNAIEQARAALDDGRLVLVWDESDASLNIVSPQDL